MRNLLSACLLLLCTCWVVSWHLKRGVIQKSIARKQVYFSSLDVAAKVISPEFAQVSPARRLTWTSYNYADLRLCHRRKLSHRWTTMHNIFLQLMLLCARLRLAKLPTVSFHIFIFQTYFFFIVWFDAAPPPTLGVLLNTLQPSLTTCPSLTIVAKSLMSRLRDTLQFRSDSNQSIPLTLTSYSDSRTETG